MPFLNTDVTVAVRQIAETPKLVQIFAYGKWLYTDTECSYTRRVRSGPNMSENAQF